MAKVKATPATGAAGASTLSAKVQKLIANVRKDVMSFGQAFAGLDKKRRELAKPFMGAYAAWKKEIEATGARASFVAFVRVIDPTVPMESAGPTGYKANSVYNACDYLRRHEANEAGGRTDTGSNRAKPVRANMSFVGRLLATIKPLVNNEADFWKGIQQEFGLKPQAVTKLQKLVNSSQPVLQLTSIKPQPMKIVHVNAETGATETAAAGKQRKAG